MQLGVALYFLYVTKTYEKSEQLQLKLINALELYAIIDPSEDSSLLPSCLPARHPNGRVAERASHSCDN